MAVLPTGTYIPALLGAGWHAVCIPEDGAGVLLTHEDPDQRLCVGCGRWVQKEAYAGRGVCGWCRK
jgi:hypothetical protein